MKIHQLNFARRARNNTCNNCHLAHHTNRVFLFPALSVQPNMPPLPSRCEVGHSLSTANARAKTLGSDVTLLFIFSSQIPRALELWKHVWMEAKSEVEHVAGREPTRDSRNLRFVGKVSSYVPLSPVSSQERSREVEKSVPRGLTNHVGGVCVGFLFFSAPILFFLSL